MKLIKHKNPKYGFFVGFSTKELAPIVPTGTPIWQPDKDKARWAFKDYIKARPHLDIEKIYEDLNRTQQFKNKITIICTW